MYDVYVRTFPNTGTNRLISNGGGFMPMWSPNSKELFFRTLDQRLMVVNYTTTGGAFVPGAPRQWWPQPLANTRMTPNVDMAPDGKGFAVLMSNETPEAPETRGHFVLVPNFIGDIRRRLSR